MPDRDLPLLVFGPRSTTYDFGPSHPLTPRRFGPGIDLLRSLGAEPGLAPEPAADDDLLLAHTRHYLEAVKDASTGLHPRPDVGLGGLGDNPAFPGIHEAAAMVAGGSMRAMEAILRGDVAHAFHPGGGLHHAMPERAAGFCVYDDPALAIAQARHAGLRTLYVDLDVHHGDGVQAIHWSDPGVLTVSFHETGRYLFPGTGFVDEVGQGTAAGTAINVPLEPGTGERAWSTAVSSLLPAVAAAFGPDIVVSQHGCDSHAWDPLAHLAVTTTAMGEAARLVDRVAHRWAGGRWLATGGGGYDAYRVVPRAWSLVWLAGAHRDAPAATSPDWRARWEVEATRYGQAPLPGTFDDEPNAGKPFGPAQQVADEASLAQLEPARAVALPALLREALARGWWDPFDSGGRGRAGAPDPTAAATIVDDVTADLLDGLRLAGRVLAPADPDQAHALVARALAPTGSVESATVVVAVAGDVIVGAAVAGPRRGDGARPVLGLGVAPEFRRRGLGTALLRALVDRTEGDISALVTVAERDVVEPLDQRTRAGIARAMLDGAGFDVRGAPGEIGRVDPLAVSALLRRS